VPSAMESVVQIFKRNTPSVDLMSAIRQGFNTLIDFLCQELVRQLRGLGPLLRGLIPQLF
jgi:lysylphosphatidylglycerol synthetase-like protein (DUF2156 family)